jgi:hypothetical protein
LDYFSSDGTVGCPALLVEPSGTNLAFNSQTWTSANNWRADVSGNITTVTGAITAPDGTMTANAISPTAVSGNHGFVSLGVTFASGTNYTMSAFFKQGTGVGRFVQLTYTTAMNSGAGFANFDLQLGTVTASGGTGNVAAEIKNYGNGWYRCIYTATCNQNAVNALGFIGNLIPTSGATRGQSFLGVTGDVLYGWGAQLETGSVATSYIPTTTGSVTRNADVVLVSGAVSGSIGQTQGTIYAEVDVRNWVNLGRIFSISDGTSNNRIMTLFNTSNRFRVIIDISGSSAQADISSASLSNGIHKIAVGYAANDVVFYVDGVLVGSDITANIPACSQVFLGKIETSASTNFINDRILDAALYTTRLSNAELAALTSL